MSHVVVEIVLHKDIATVQVRGGLAERTLQTETADKHKKHLMLVL